MGYESLPMLLEAVQYGSCCSRGRLYVLAFLVRGPDDEGLQMPTAPEAAEEDGLQGWRRDCRDLLEVTKVEPLPREDFFLPVGHHLSKQWKQHPQLGSLDRPNPGASSKCVWEADHCSAFQQAAIPWPPVFSPAFSMKTSHLCRRKAEVVYYFEHTLPKTSLHDCSVDINYSINWARPWFGKFGCIVGTSHTWCFGRSLDAHNVPVADEEVGLDLSGEEMLSLQCFPLPDLDFSTTSKYSPQELTELAGNAFNGAVVAAALLAMITAAPWDQIDGGEPASSEGLDVDDGNGSEFEHEFMAMVSSQESETLLQRHCHCLGFQWGPTYCMLHMVRTGSGLACRVPDLCLCGLLSRIYKSGNKNKILIIDNIDKVT